MSTLHLPVCCVTPVPTHLCDKDLLCNQGSGLVLSGGHMVVNKKDSLISDLAGLTSGFKDSHKTRDYSKLW